MTTLRLGSIAPGKLFCQKRVIFGPYLTTRFNLLKKQTLKLKLPRVISSSTTSLVINGLFSSLTLLISVSIFFASVRKRE